MVDNLSSQQIAPNEAFHDDPMLQGIPNAGVRNLARVRIIGGHLYELVTIAAGFVSTSPSRGSGALSAEHPIGCAAKSLAVGGIVSARQIAVS